MIEKIKDDEEMMGRQEEESKRLLLTFFLEICLLRHACVCEGGTDIEKLIVSALRGNIFFW